MTSDIYKRVSWRIMPFLLICYTLAYLDRVNVSFAKIQMIADLGLSETIYGLGAGIFFIGYFLFEVPSNYILVKIGASRWLGFLMVIWELIEKMGVYFKTFCHYVAYKNLLALV